MIFLGVDVPLLEIAMGFLIVIFILLIEVIIIVSLLIKQLNKTKMVGELIEKLSETLLAIKKAEIEELDTLRGRKR